MEGFGNYNGLHVSMYGFLIIRTLKTKLRSILTDTVVFEGRLLLQPYND